MNLRPNKKKEDEEQERAYQDAIAQHEEIGGVDSTISETINAMRVGREEVAERFYRQQEGSDSNESAHPLDMLRTGRKRILAKINETSKWKTPVRRGLVDDGEHGIHSLNRQLYERLEEIAQEVRPETSQTSLMEMEIQAAIKGYLVALNKILNPLRFSRDSIQVNNRFEGGNK